MSFWRRDDGTAIDTLPAAGARSWKTRTTIELAGWPAGRLAAAAVSFSTYSFPVCYVRPSALCDGVRRAPLQNGGGVLRNAEGTLEYRVSIQRSARRDSAVHYGCARQHSVAANPSSCMSNAASPSVHS